MKKTVLILLILLPAAVLPVFADNSITAGLNFYPGLLYNGSWDPAFEGTAAEVVFTHKRDIFSFGTGIEAGMDYNSFNLMLPVSAGIGILRTERMEIETSVVLLPGIMLIRPVPRFIASAEITADLNWKIGSGFGLEISAGPRYTAFPDFATGRLTGGMLNLNLGFAAVFDLN